MDGIWFVRAGQESVFVEDFLQYKIVAIGWPELGELDTGISKTQLLQHYRLVYPDHAEGKAQVDVSQILRFMNEPKIGDTVMTYNRDRQIYSLGTITSDSLWRPDLISELPRIRQVDWKHMIPRAVLSGEAKNTLGALLTLSLVRKDAAREIREKALASQQPEATPITIPASSVNDIDVERDARAELLEKSEQAIEDRLVRLDWEQVQELVAGLLRAMGYRTTVSPRGSDRGVDIFASPDGLGLEEPRIFVEVKHRPTTPMGSQDLRSFLGGRSSGDRCLYVSTGGFTKEARYEADRSSIAIRLLGLVDLRRLLVDYYDKLDGDIKSLVPLRRVYVLAE